MIELIKIPSTENTPIRGEELCGITLIGHNYEVYQVAWSNRVGFYFTDDIQFPQEIIKNLMICQRYFVTKHIDNLYILDGVWGTRYERQLYELLQSGMEPYQAFEVVAL